MHGTPHPAPHTQPPRPRPHPPTNTQGQNGDDPRKFKCSNGNFYPGGNWGEGTVTDPDVLSFYNITDPATFFTLDVNTSSVRSCASCGVCMHGTGEARARQAA